MRGCERELCAQRFAKFANSRLRGGCERERERRVSRRDTRSRAPRRSQAGWFFGFRSAIAARGALKVVKVCRGYEEDPHRERDRHCTAHLEDRGADVVIFQEGEGTADESQG